MSNLTVEAAFSTSGRVGSHRFKGLLQRSEQRVGDDGDVQRLSLSSAGYLYDRGGASDRQLASSTTEQRSLRVEPDQLVVNPMWLTGGSIAVSGMSGAVSPDYRVFTPRTDVVYPRFLHHLLRSQPYRDQYNLFIRANTTFDRRIQQADLDQLPLWLPPLEEQQRIADFLDDRIFRIDRIISARNSQAKAVWAAHQSLSIALVTSGSGQWLEGSLRRFLKSEDGRRVPLTSEERSTRSGPYPYYGASGVIDHVDDYLFEGPRVLLSEDGANLLLRSSAIAFVADGQYWVNNHAHILQAEDGAHHFWAARLEALDVSPWVTGSAQPKLTIDAALSLPLSAPAEPKRRREIGIEIAALTESSRGRVAQLSESVGLLTEYKLALITAAVTADLDVTTTESGTPGTRGV